MVVEANTRVRQTTEMQKQRKQRKQGNRPAHSTGAAYLGFGRGRRRRTTLGAGGLFAQLNVSPNAIAAALVVGIARTRCIAVVRRYTDRAGRRLVCAPTVLVLENGVGGFAIARVETETGRLEIAHGWSRHQHPDQVASGELQARDNLLASPSAVLKEAQYVIS